MSKRTHEVLELPIRKVKGGVCGVRAGAMYCGTPHA